MKNKTFQPLDGGHAISLVESAALFVTVALSAIVLVWILWQCQFGYDFTDEGYYLHWISDPWRYEASTTQFGFIYHPSYRLFSGDVVLLRQFNILVMFGLAWILCNTLLSELGGRFAEPGKFSRIRSVSISAVLAISSLNYFQFWLPTPSYNSLALQAMLVAAIGALRADRQISGSSIAGWVLIGISGWLAFMAKPTSAAALAVLISFYLLAAGKLDFRLMAIAVGTAVVLLIFGAFAIDGSIIGFVDRLATGMRLAEILSSKNLLRLDDFELNDRLEYYLLTCSAVVLIGAISAHSRSGLARIPGIAVSLLFALFAGSVIFQAMSIVFGASTFRGLLLWSVPIGALLAIIVVHFKVHGWPINRQNTALAIFLALLPYAYAFGSSNNYWLMQSQAGLFWVLFGVVMLGPLRSPDRRWPILLPVAACAQAITILTLQYVTEHPYRQSEPLQRQAHHVQVPSGNDNLRVSEITAAYIHGLSKITTTAGFQQGSPMIDLTGHSPGTLFAIGAKSVGQAWLLGGYEKSDSFAAASLDLASCKTIARAWILAEPDGPRHLSASLLERYGIDLAEDYVNVGSIGFPKGDRQIVFKPITSIDANMKCEALRAQRK